MGSVPSVYSTGINDFYNPLPSGSLDFHYSLTTPGTPIGSQVFATTADTTGTGWIQPWDNARWIATSQDPATLLQSVTYYAGFNLDRFDASTAVITGEWAASGAAEIYLNGLSTNITVVNDNGTVKHPFTLTGPFTGGINWLSFTVASEGGRNGLLVSMAGTAQPVPEPSAIISTAIGAVVGAICLMWRKRQCRKSITPITPN